MRQGIIVWEIRSCSSSLYSNVLTVAVTGFMSYCDLKRKVSKPCASSVLKAQCCALTYSVPSLWQEHSSLSSTVVLLILPCWRGEAEQGVWIGKETGKGDSWGLLSLTLLEDQKAFQCCRDSVAQIVVNEPLVFHKTSKGKLQGSSN